MTFINITIVCDLEDILLQVLAILLVLFFLLFVFWLLVGFTIWKALAFIELAPILSRFIMELVSIYSRFF